jgi:aminopeptidase-like protein
MNSTEGEHMHTLAERLFPIGRSLTGNGVRETLSILQEQLPLTIHEVPSGTSVFDWTVPKEWNITDAYIVDPDGKKIAEYAKNNLHIVGYSVPVDKEISLDELQKHLYSIEAQPDAIPYITSYYEERWGFCMTHHERLLLKPGTYRVFIESELIDGSLTYGECIIPGKSEKEIFLSTYVCHPSMANNELSGPVVTAFLARWIASKSREYTYRIIFIPETIGSLTYISQHLPEMKKNIIAGFNLTCVGDERAYSFLPSRAGNTLADRAAVHVLTNEYPEFISYSFLQRGSDERQYCSPGVDLPVVSIMRSKYSTYPEYHTSLDDLTFVTPKGLQGSYNAIQSTIDLIEHNHRYQAVYCGEPQLGKRGLYPTLSSKGSSDSVQVLLDILTYADGEKDLIALAETIGKPAKELYEVVEKLVAAGVLRRVT